MTDRIDAFFDEADAWRDELLALRAILAETDLDVEWKWNQPVYTAHGGNIGTMWGFKEACTLGFFKGVLLKDPEGLLEAPGENSRSSRVLKFRSVAEIEAKDAVIRAFVAEAIANEKAGLKVEFPKDDLEYPAELVDRLDGDTDFRTAFEALTPGRRRGWVLHFSGAKQSATRASRIDKAAPKILAGKGWNGR